MNRILILASVAALALVAGGAAYWSAARSAARTAEKTALLADVRAGRADTSTRLQRAVGETGLAERTRAIGDAPNGILRLRIESASFDAVMTLLARLDEREALRPSGVAITAGSESGRVDATLDFAGVTR